MRGWERKPKERPGDRYRVSGFIPPQPMVKIAADRTDGMLGMYMHYGARTADLPVLVRSAYMQGVNDVVGSLFKAGYEIVKREANG
jgi:hypothetical protein